MKGTHLAIVIAVLLAAFVLVMGMAASDSDKSRYPDVVDPDGPTEPQTPDDPGEGGDSRPATAGERNALDKAKSYLSWMEFSERGLYDQLIFEKFTEAEARYGVDNCGADWQDQANKAARGHLSTSHMGPGQLRYLLHDLEKFTEAQADNAIQNLGAVDWQGEADLRAKYYSETFSQSRTATYDDLVREGFTEDQAHRAVAKVYG